jgi:opacity protein-like surface antigen
MKKLFIAALLTVSVAASAFASDVTTGNKLIKKAFTSSFKNASNVKWTNTGDLVKASFFQNGEKIEAFYDNSGEIICTSKSIGLDELPTAIKRSFSKNYDGYTVREAIKIDANGEGYYPISLQRNWFSYPESGRGWCYFRILITEIEMYK